MNGPILVRWQKGNRIAESVGWVVAETGQRVILAGTCDGEHRNGLVQILTGDIRERVALEELGWDVRRGHGGDGGAR